CVEETSASQSSRASSDKDMGRSLAWFETETFLYLLARQLYNVLYSHGDLARFKHRCETRSPCYPSRRPVAGDDHISWDLVLASNDSSYTTAVHDQVVDS